VRPGSTSRRAGASTPVSVDGGNPIPSLALGEVDLYAPTEAQLLARYPGATLEEAMDGVLDDGPRLVVVTRGEAGSVAAERLGGETVMHRAPAPSVAPFVSTLGAGDVFHGALLAALVDGGAVPAALELANAAAALSCRALDGRGAIPSRGELEETLGASRSNDRDGAPSR
jgi:sulfofructose kinase